MAKSKKYNYDVFLSHSSKDKPAVRELAKRLEKDGLRVWLDEWMIKAGHLIPREIQRGIDASRVMILFMSEPGFRSDWVHLEYWATLFLDPSNTDQRFIPVRLDNVETPSLLRQFACVDWRTPSDAEYARLIEVCRPASAPEGAGIAKARNTPTKVLRGHQDSVQAIAITHDGRRAVSGSIDKTVRVWDLERRACLATLEGHKSAVHAVAVTHDGRRTVSGSGDGTVRVWDLERRACLATLEGHKDWVHAVAVTRDGRRTVSGSVDGTMRVWDLERGACLVTLEGHEGPVLAVAVTHDGRRTVSGSGDKTVRVWDLERGTCLATLEGHKDWVYAVAVTRDGRAPSRGRTTTRCGSGTWNGGRAWPPSKGTKTLSTPSRSRTTVRAVSGSGDGTVRVWDLERGACPATLEGHKSWVHAVAVTHDGRRAVSGSVDGTVRVWDLSEELPDEASPTESVRYTNAKVFLTGDSGVGKTGLALRMVHDTFEATVSTDGVWATHLKLPEEAGAAAGMEREVWLWDFAGQADYRLAHQLYMDGTAVAVLVFNPQADNPFEGLSQWNRDLTRGAGGKPFKKLLVAGRCDVGGVRVSGEQISRFVARHEFADFHETSAKSGTGCKELKEAILGCIPWDDLPYTVSPRIFKRIKEEIIKLKDVGRVLLRVVELKQLLEMRMPDDPFTPGELNTVVGLLAGAGVVWKLAFADYVLLQPERINSYAAALVRKVRKYVDEIGCILEGDVLAGKLDFEGMERLEPDDEAEVLRVLVQTLVGRGLCLKEDGGKDGPLLVFPAYFRRDRPEWPDHPTPFVSYRFTGSLDEVYTTLVVRLHHTIAFDKDQLWRDAADFKTPAGLRAGLMLGRDPELSSGVITVYLDPAISDEVKVIFMRYVHDHLHAGGRATDIERTRIYVCPVCHETVKDGEAAMRRLRQGKPDIACVHCDERVPLLDLIEQLFASEKIRQGSREWDERAQARINTQSLKLILTGHAESVAREAGYTFVQSADPAREIDGEIALKDRLGAPSGHTVGVKVLADDFEWAPFNDFKIRPALELAKDRVDEWRRHHGRVMLVFRTPEGVIEWVDVRDDLRENLPGDRGGRQKFILRAEPFTAKALVKLRDRLIPDLSQGA